MVLLKKHIMYLVAYMHRIQCSLPSKLVVAFGFLDKDYVEQEQVEEVLKWFITMTCEGLFPNISTLVVVYGYDTLHCV